MESVVLFMETWDPVIQTTIRAIVIPLVIYGGLVLRNWVSKQMEKIGAEKDIALLNEYILLIDEMIHDAVITVEKTFVESLKKQGKWDADFAVEAFHLVKMRVTEQLTDDVKIVLSKALKDYEEWITDKVEAEVSRL